MFPLLLALPASVHAQSSPEMVLGDDGQLTPYDIETQPYEMVEETTPSSQKSDDILATDEPSDQSSSSGKKPSTIPAPTPVTDDTALSTVFNGKPPLISGDMLMRIGLSFLVVMLLLLAFFKWGLPMVLKSPSVRHRMGMPPQQPFSSNASTAEAMQYTLPDNTLLASDATLPETDNRYSGPHAMGAGPSWSAAPSLESQSNTAAAPPAEWPAVNAANAYGHYPGADSSSLASFSATQPASPPAPIAWGSPAGAPASAASSTTDWTASANNMALPMTVIKRFQLNRHDAVEFVTIWDRYFLVAYSRLGSLLLAEFTVAAVPTDSGMTPAWQCVPSHMPVRHPAAQWLAQYPQLAEECVAFLSQPVVSNPSASLSAGFSAIPSPYPSHQSASANTYLATPSAVHPSTTPSAATWSSSGAAASVDHSSPVAISPGRAAMAAAAPVALDSASALPTEDAPSRLGALLRKYLPSDKFFQTEPLATAQLPTSPTQTSLSSEMLPLPEQFAVFQKPAAQVVSQRWQDESDLQGPEDEFRSDIYSQVPPMPASTTVEGPGTELAESPSYPHQATATVMDYGPAPDVKKPSAPAAERPSMPPLSERALEPVSPPESETPESETLLSSSIQPPELPPSATPSPEALAPDGVDVRLAASGSQAVDRLKSMRTEDVTGTLASSAPRAGNRPFSPTPAEQRSPMRVHPIDEDIEIFDDYDDTF